MHQMPWHLQCCSPRQILLHLLPEDHNVILIKTSPEPPFGPRQGQHGSVTSDHQSRLCIVQHAEKMSLMPGQGEDPGFDTVCSSSEPYGTQRTVHVWCRCFILPSFSLGMSGSWAPFSLRSSSLCSSPRSACHKSGVHMVSTFCKPFQLIQHLQL